MLVACAVTFVFKPRVSCVSAGVDSLSMEVHIVVPEPFTVIFSGDLMQHMPQIEAARIKDSASLSDTLFDYRPSFDSHSELWRSADFAVINLETTISAGTTYSGYPMFSAPAALVRAMAEAGITTAMLANNHILDKGMLGLQTTMQTLDKHGIGHTGAYADTVSARKILYLEKPYYKVALLNYTYGMNGNRVPQGVVVNTIDTVLIAGHIAQCRRDSATHIIAMMHWGAEYQRRENAEQRRLAQWLRKAGVDVVVGSHPHVVQPVDTAMRVAYSLGNFVSNQQDPHTDYGVSLRLTISRNDRDDSSTHKFAMETLPHWVDRADKYRVLTPRDTITCQKPQFYKALRDARLLLGCPEIIE